MIIDYCNKPLRLALGAVFTILFFTLLLPAQSSRGTIVGAVTDPSGGPVPDVQVTVTNVATNVAYSFVTDQTGNYYVPSLLPGHYRVDAGKTGFKKAMFNDVPVEVNQTVRVDIPLQLGELTQAVQVSGNSPLVQTDSATLGQVVTNRQVTELPLNGRDFTNLIKLNVGVTEVQGGISTSIRRHGLNDSFRSVSVNGSRPSSISYLIDGVSSNETLFQTPTSIPPIDAIQEFKLQNGLFSAEFGMGTAQVNIAMKSGTNTLHGSLWNFLRNDALQKQNPRFHTKTPLKQNQFGGTVGGPVFLPHIYNGKDKTFFFFGYQGGRRRSGFIGQAQVPTEQERQGNFSDWPVQLFNPLTGVANPGGTPAVTRQPFANNQIPSSMLAPQSLKLLQYFPSPNINCALPCNNFQRGVVSPSTVDNYTLRMDHDISNGDRFSGQFLLQNENAFSPAVVPLSGTNNIQNSRLAGLQWTHIFSPRTLNEFRAGFNRQYYLLGFETAFGPVNYWKDAGLQNLRDSGAYNALPAIVLGTQYTGIGNGGSLPFFNISNTFQWVDNLTMTRGRHSLKAGADIRRNQNMNENGLGGNGLLNFQGSYTARNPLLPQAAGKLDTGNGFADYLLGYPNGAPATRFAAFDQSFSRLRNTDYMFFFQDDFRVHPRLTLNLGLRWELHTPFEDKFNGGNIFDFGYPGGRLLYRDKSFVDTVNNPILAACCAKDTLINTDWRDFAPRIGLAWRPLASTNKLVVRAGYAISYGVLQNFYPTQSVTQNIPFLSPTLPTPTGMENQPPLDIRNLFPAPYSVSQRQFPGPYCQAPSANVVDPVTGVITKVTNACFDARVQLPDNKNPYTQQYGLNLQYQPQRDLLVEVGYQGSHSLRLPAGWTFNQAYLPPQTGNPNNSVLYRSQCPPGTYPDRCSPIQDRVPYGNFNPAITSIANIFQSGYNGMTLKVDKRFAQGLQMLGSFTWSKAIDQASEIAALGGAAAERAQYSHSLNLERGLANFDQTRRLVMSWVYDLPFGMNRQFLNHGGFLNRLVGGWQANGIVTLSDGTPFTVGCYCGDRSQTGDTRNTLRMNTTGNPLPDGFNRTDTKWFDTSVFATPALGTLGTSARNTLRSTPQRATDFSLFKNNQIGERVNVQFRAEFFNLFSSHYYQPVFPSANPQATNFGSLLPPGGDSGNLFNPRVIQFALRLAF